MHTPPKTPKLKLNHILAAAKQNAGTLPKPDQQQQSQSSRGDKQADAGLDGPTRQQGD